VVSEDRRLKLPKAAAANQHSRVFGRGLVQHLGLRRAKTDIARPLEAICRHVTATPWAYVAGGLADWQRPQLKTVVRDFFTRGYGINRSLNRAVSPFVPTCGPIPLRCGRQAPSQPVSKRVSFGARYVDYWPIAAELAARILIHRRRPTFLPF